MVCELKALQFYYKYNVFAPYFRILIGAPTADVGQPDVVKGGAVFRCDPFSSDKCYIIPFDKKGLISIYGYLKRKQIALKFYFFVGNTVAPTGQQYDKKSGQWFGALVRSSGENGSVLVSEDNCNVLF